jgi:hypothetical protein
MVSMQQSRQEEESLELELPQGKTRRRSVRRAVQFECNLESESWDGIVVLPATDLSNEGLFIESHYALDEGEEVVVSFPLPGDGEPGRIWAIAEVARVGMWRRRGEARASGMGLAFTYFSNDDRTRLDAALRGLPPPLPTATITARSVQPPPLPSQLDGPHKLAELEEETLPAVLDWLIRAD